MEGHEHYRSRPAGIRPLVLFIALFLLLANGRMDSGDANAELQAALNFIRTGSLGTDRPYADPAIQSLFVRSSGGRYYEAHDIGNSLLMIPAAWIAVTVPLIFPGLDLRGSVSAYSDASLILAKTLCSLTDTVFSGVACYFLFLLFRLFLGRRTSMVLALLFPFGSYFAGYFRSSWDVVPACDAFCILLYFFTGMFAENEPQTSTPKWAAFWCGIACLFRYSLLPFLALSMALVFWQNRHRYRASTYLFSAMIFAATLLPTLLFNLVRMDSLFKPATMSPQFYEQNGLTWNIIPAAAGLLVSPNRGLLVFSPLVLLLIALPWCWRQLPASIRAVLTCLAPGVLCYFFLISRLRNWGAAGWGPRYLLPIFPLLFMAAGYVLTILRKRGRAWRLATSIVILIACSVAVPAIMVNHTAAIRPDAMAIDTGERTPRQILDTLHSFVSALNLRSAGTPGMPEKEGIVVFPDLAATRVFLMLCQKSLNLAMAFVFFYLLAIASILFAMIRIIEPAGQVAEKRSEC